MLRLLVHDPYQRELVLQLSWSEGTVRIDAADPLVRPDVDRWLSRGLIELIATGTGTDRSLVQRVTEASDPLFLPRVAESLHRQFGYMVTLESP